MDFSFARPFPYSIPGPAGDTHLLTPSSPHIALSMDEEVWGGREASGSIEARSFTSGAWQAMLASEKIAPYGRGKMCSSISSLKKKAFSDGFVRSSRIYVRIMDIKVIGRDVLVLFGDITGQIYSTMNKKVMEKENGNIEVGSVLLLEAVGGMLCLDEHPDLLRKMGSAYVHLIVQAENIARVFPYAGEAPSALPVPPPELKHLRDAYADEVLQISERPAVLQRMQLRHLLNRRLSLLYTQEKRRRESQKCQRGARKLQSVTKSKARGKKQAGVGKPAGTFHARSPESCSRGYSPVAYFRADASESISTEKKETESLCDDGLDDLFLSLDVEAIISAGKR